MDPFSLTIGSLTILDECLKCGKLLVQLYNDYQQAETEVSEAFLKLKVVWLQIETQVVVLKKIWETLPPDYQQTQLTLLGVLDTKLNEAYRLLNSIVRTASRPGISASAVTDHSTLSKIKYAIIKKKDLDRSVAELIEWHRLFDQVWCLLARVPGHEIDRTLESQPRDTAIKLLTSLRKSVTDLNSEDKTPHRDISSRDFLELRTLITASCAATAQFDDKTNHAVVDTMLVNPKMDAAGTTRSVIALTKALSRSDPASFGLLRCCGVINKTTQYEFVFEIPQGLSNTPQSLRDLLLNRQPALNVKVDIAKQLSNSVFHLHAIGFVHKNIRPDSVLVFYRGDDQAVFLVGFENYRMIQDETFFTGDDKPERDLYRHPSRQGINLQRRYMTQHDIYSLGVCLLEIGLWTSFVGTGQHGAVLGSGIDVGLDDPIKKAYAIKKKLLTMVDEQLAPLVGMQFKAVVETCLTWLDKEQVNEAAKPAVDVGLEFIDTVLLPLRKIVV